MANVVRIRPVATRAELPEEVPGVRRHLGDCESRRPEAYQAAQAEADPRPLTEDELMDVLLAGAFVVGLAVLVLAGGLAIPAFLRWASTWAL